ncbi:hypothetical protein H6F86_02010 [Phormidium sp. FACHB-592]|uniref:Uncharacterized protein n=1 Tax=Stenomitos frigidus AS-A4 TaxID=2933935 RepID=A0ABV0KMF0_9CYAN|nr:hypothetical protein [Phormidium sp. FACHB-592]MBD2072681.1 hypothetical protein [Phormidium sp. FACHB-592]
MFTHIVTLIDRRTESEESLTVKTGSDTFSDVMREIWKLRADRGLTGYEVHEILACAAPF